MKIPGRSGIYKAIFYNGGYLLLFGENGKVLKFYE